MPFSLSSYLLGVATVLGALAFGFGGGVLLTHTVMKESPAGKTRAERLVRVEPETPGAPQPQAAQTPVQPAVARSQATPTGQDNPASLGTNKQDAGVTERADVVSPDPIPAAPEHDPARKFRDAPTQIQAQPPKHVEQTERSEAKPVNRSEADRSRSRGYVERTQPGNSAPRTRQRGFLAQEEPMQDVVRSRPPHLPLFAGFFGRPADANE